MRAGAAGEEQKKVQGQEEKRSKDNEQLKDEGDENAVSTVLSSPAPAPRKKIPANHIGALVRAVADPECAYLIGASIWWDLLDEEALQLVASSRNSEYTTTTDDGQRAELALMFLQQAVQRGCADGYLEMQKAYELLSKLYKEKHTKTLKMLETTRAQALVHRN